MLSGLAIHEFVFLLETYTAHTDIPIGHRSEVIRELPHYKCDNSPTNSHGGALSSCKEPDSPDVLYPFLLVIAIEETVDCVQ